MYGKIRGKVDTLTDSLIDIGSSRHLCNATDKDSRRAETNHSAVYVLAMDQSGVHDGSVGFQHLLWMAFKNQSEAVSSDVAKIGQAHKRTLKCGFYYNIESVVVCAQKRMYKCVCLNG